MEIRQSAEDYLESILVLSKKEEEFVPLILRPDLVFPSQASVTQ